MMEHLSTQQSGQVAGSHCRADVRHRFHECLAGTLQFCPFSSTPTGRNDWLRAAAYAQRDGPGGSATLSDVASPSSCSRDAPTSKQIYLLPFNVGSWERRGGGIPPSTLLRVSFDLVHSAKLVLHTKEKQKEKKKRKFLHVYVSYTRF
ncbi:hypothetical protein OPV22_029452 [Ensete ventricosum]|uniref:Uncharacterized protein n=1 Tax=Ensete ventricosum TaxID=4639 RepID=A0AAV8Q5U1_ENSVE|nr:hypothetical protein OPV22_029452 [Ensete ventricosum]